MQRVSLWYNDTEYSQSSEGPIAGLLRIPKGNECSIFKGTDFVRRFEK
jgi:hypothetical protein